MIAKTVLSAALLLAAALPAAAQDTDAAHLHAPNGKYVMRDGEAIFRNVCAGCHMADAKGAKGAGAYPALAANARLAGAAYPIHVVVKGQKGMPAFGALMDDEQVAAVVGYIRTHFDNHYAAAVTAAEVHAQR